MASVAGVRTWPARLLARPWLLAFVPINAATACFGIALPLLILTTLGGGWATVALAATLFNAALIAGSLLWGYLSDRIRRRRLFLAINCVGFGVTFLALGFVPSLPALLVLYTLVGFLAPAGTNAANLLILESFSEAERPNAYASFQEMSILGALAGLALGAGWVATGRELGPLLFVLAGLSLASALWGYLAIPEPRARHTPAAVARHAESLVARLHVYTHRPSIPFFPRLPSLTRSSFARFRRWVREESSHELPWIFGASFLFNITANLFNISYTPYLYSIGIGSTAIFLVNMGNNLSQATAFPLSGSLSETKGVDRVVHWSTYVRSIGYLAVVGFTLVPSIQAGAFGANVIAYAVMGGAIAFYSTASSLILFRALRGRDAGRILGVNGALGGVAAVGGGLFSSVLAVIGSFTATFLVSGVLLLASLPLWTAARIAADRRRSVVSGRASVAGPSDATAA